VSVELARDRLIALRAHFALDAGAPGAQEADRALSEVQLVLDELHDPLRQIEELVHGHARDPARELT
jgi:hypothetical protein